MIKTKWFIYSLIVGLIPFLVRISIFIVANQKDLTFLFNAMDFAALGLVLNITNINELEGRNIQDLRWKSQCIGISVVFIILYTALLTITSITELNATIFDRTSIVVSSVIASLTSALFGYSIFNRLAKSEQTNG